MLGEGDDGGEVRSAAVARAATSGSKSVTHARIDVAHLHLLALLVVYLLDHALSLLTKVLDACVGCGEACCVCV